MSAAQHKQRGGKREEREGLTRESTTPRARRGRGRQLRISEWRLAGSELQLLGGGNKQTPCQNICDGRERLSWAQWRAAAAGAADRRTGRGISLHRAFIGDCRLQEKRQ